jgi:hypothetical protein
MGRTSHRISHRGLQLYSKIAVLPVSGNAGEPFFQITRKRNAFAGGLCSQGLSRVVQTRPLRRDGCCNRFPTPLTKHHGSLLSR